MNSRNAIVLKRLREANTTSAESADVDPDAVESVQLSRFQRPRPRNWLGRLINSPFRYEDTLQAQFRSARAELVRLECVCDDSELLDVLPWLDIQDVTEVSWPVMAKTLRSLSGEYLVPILLGEPNEKPEALSKPLSRKQRKLIGLSEAKPSEAAWGRLCDALSALPDDGLLGVLFRLKRALTTWPDELKRAPEAWLAPSPEPPFLNPRLDIANPHLSNILDIELRNPGLDAEAVRAVVESPHVSSLTSLWLESPLLGDEGARVIADSPHLSSLTWLRLDSIGMADEGARALAESPHLSSLTDLFLGNNSIGDEGACAIAESPHLSSLTELELVGNHIGDKGARAIAESLHMASLNALDLGGNDIGDEGARSIAESPHLTSLKRLSLGQNDIGPETRTVLRESELGQRLLALNL